MAKALLIACPADLLLDASAVRDINATPQKALQSLPLSRLFL
jgi:hypothetical protein